MKLVQNRKQLENVVRSFEGCERVFLDTEFESTRSGTTLCVVQLTRGDEIHLIDALQLRRLEGLGDVLADAEWVLHAGLQDVELLMEAFDCRRRPRVFDTQVGWAMIGAESSVSLPYLIFRVTGVRTMKSHQADDWKRRPLPPKQLAYAAQDVEHLGEIYGHIADRAHELDRLELVYQVSEELLWPTPEPESRLGLSSFRGAWQLDPKSQAALRYLIDWYNDLEPDEKRAAPNSKTFISIASRLPENRDALARIKGLPGRWVAKNGTRFVDRLRRAVDAETEGDFEPIAPSPYASFEEIQLDAWLGMMRAEVCTELSIAPELALPSKVVKRMKGAIEESGSRSEGVSALSGWRGRLLGNAYLAYCERDAG